MGSLHAHEQIIARRSKVYLENAFQLKVNMKNQKPRGSKKNYKSVPKGRESSQKGRIQKGEYSPYNVCKKNNHLENDCYHHGKPIVTSCKNFGHVDNLENL